MARSLLFQLAPLSTSFMSELHKEHHAGRKEIELQTVVDAILKIVAGSDYDVFLIIDALDECSKGGRSKLLKFLKDIKNWSFDNLHVLVTGRKEEDIQTEMRQIASHSICVNSTDVDSDIAKYIEEQLALNQFKRWSSDIKQEIFNSVTAHSDGM